MKQLMYSFLMFLISVSLVSCEEDDAELMFTTVACAPQSNVKIEYYSPDPVHVDRTYWITANKNASELVIRCSNASNISIVSLSDALPDDYDPDVEVDGIVEDARFISPNGCWSVTLVDDNTLKFVFDEVKEPNLHYIYGVVSSGLTIAAQGPKGKLETWISILRLLDNSTPIN